MTFDANSPASAAVTTSASISASAITLAAGFTGSLTLSNPLTTTGAISLIQGTLNTSGQTVSCLSFGTTLTNSRTLTMGSSSITCTNSGATAFSYTGSGLTITANTATITLSNAGNVTVAGANWNGASLVINGAGTSVCRSMGTWANFTRTGTAVKTDGMTLNGTLTVTGTLTLTGNSLINRLFVQPCDSSGTISPGTAATFSVATTITNTNVDFMDITGSGAGTGWASGTSIGDCLGNSGITFTVAAGTSNGGNGVKRYWVGNAATGDVTTSWSTSSGGSSGASVPLPQDDIYFDSNSFNTTGLRAILNMPRTARHMDATGCNKASTTLGAGSGTPIGFFGNVTYGGTAVDDVNASGSVTYMGRSSYTLTNNGGTRYGSQVIQAPGGTYTLQDDFKTTNGNNKGLSINNGTFDANGKNLLWQTYTINTTTVSGVKMGSGQWQIGLSAGGQAWTMNSAANVLSCQTSTIVYLNATSAARTFAGGGATYYLVDFHVAGSTGAVTITGANTFNDIYFSDSTNARTLTFPGSTTTTFTATHALTNVFGLSGKLMTINSSAGTATLAFPNGYGGGSDWLSVSNITATTNTWYAGANSTNVTGNTNVTFSAPPSGTVSSSTALLLGVG